MTNTPANALNLPTDPLFNLQWHLLNTGQTGGTAGVDLNVVEVWQEYTGRGVKVGVIDDGIEYTHPDLAPNYDTSLDYDAGNDDGDPMPLTDDDYHGTPVAGIIGAAANNGQGGAGVAHGATIAGVKLGTGLGEQRALQQMVRFDVVNNSWGYDYPFAASFNTPEFQPYGATLQNAAQNGRNGLGTAIVFAAGNIRGRGNSNYSNLDNSRFTIAVGALNHHGTHTWYSNAGANLLVSAFGGDADDPDAWDGIVTTDRLGAPGLSPSLPFDHTQGMGGTSAAAPMVSGVIALMLEANPLLGYRDIQEILAYSARHNDSTNSSWQWNGATNWNGGGMHTSHDYGFGMVDARSAVRLAESWTMQKTAANERQITTWRSPMQPIRDNRELVDTATIATGLEIDRVELTLNLDHTFIGDLNVTLTSPSGTRSLLIDDSLARSAAAGSDRIRFTFSSTQFWGETGAGEWKLSVQDRSTGETGTLRNWSLRLFGDWNSDNDTYIYTNEYAKFTDPMRRTLSDSLGTDTINAAAVNGEMTINLTPGSSNTIAGTPLVLGANTLIENAIGGDGSDTMLGNSLRNSLNGMRGNDSLNGGGEADVLTGGRGNDWLIGDAGNDTLSGGQGNDRFIYRTGAMFTAAAVGIDRILDFVRGNDAIVLSKATFRALRSVAQTGFSVTSEFTAVADDMFAAESGALIVYSQSSGNLYYNPNSMAAGFGRGGRFATLTDMPTLRGSDFVIQA